MLLKFVMKAWFNWCIWCCVRADIPWRAKAKEREERKREGESGVSGISFPGFGRKKGFLNYCGRAQSLWMTFVFCGFVFDSSDEKTRQMPVVSEDWVPHPAKITSSITTVKGATIQSTTTAWMSPYSRTTPPDRGGANNNNNNNGVVILDGCRPPAATTARRFFRWFSRLGQPPMGKSGKEAEMQDRSNYYNIAITIIRVVYILKWFQIILSFSCEKIWIF